jgi:MOSC domain-containing protein YiiM
MIGRLQSIAVKAGPRQPVQELKRASVSIDAGMAGDWRGKAVGRQITILFSEDWAKAVTDLDPSALWTVRRANLLVSGLANPKAAGGVLAIGRISLFITGETTPCSRMEQQLPGLRAALTPDWRGGLTANVIEGGEIGVGDVARWVASRE